MNIDFIALVQQKWCAAFLQLQKIYKKSNFFTQFFIAIFW